MMKHDGDEAKGKRYSEAEKARILAYVDSVNAEKRKGGQSAAVKKFGINALTIGKWVRDRKGLGIQESRPQPTNPLEVLAAMSTLVMAIITKERELEALKEQVSALLESL